MAGYIVKESEAATAWRPLQGDGRPRDGSIIGGAACAQQRERCVQDALSELHKCVGGALESAAALVDRLDPITQPTVETSAKMDPATPSSGVALVAELDDAIYRVQELRRMLDNQLARTRL